MAASSDISDLASGARVRLRTAAAMVLWSFERVLCSMLSTVLVVVSVDFGWGSDIFFLPARHHEMTWFGSATRAGTCSSQGTQKRIGSLPAGHSQLAIFHHEIMAARQRGQYVILHPLPPRQLGTQPWQPLSQNVADVYSGDHQPT